MPSIRHPATNTDFGTAVLHAIATDPRLRQLAAVLVLKGGAALLLGYESGRATRRDLDFDVRSEYLISEGNVTALFAALAAWRAQYIPGGRVKSGPKSQEIGEIAFRDPHTGDIGQIKIQVSRRRLPPTLHERIRLHTFQDPVSGATFGFPVMSLEAIAAEKMVRSFKQRDEAGFPAPGPSMNDMYDIGFIAAWRPQVEVTEVRLAFNLLRRLEQADGIVIESARLDALALRAYAATDIRSLMGDGRVVDVKIGFATAQKRVLEGIRATKATAGLAGTLPARPTGRR